MTEERAEKFLELFNKGKEFTEELLRENQRLRYRLATLETGSTAGVDEEVQRLRAEVQHLTEENRRIARRFKEVEEENKDFANRYIEVEEQNNNLANLYVASYQLHSTLDFREVIQIVQEIVINLIGAESFAILLLDEKTNELKTIASEGEDVMPGIETISTRLGDGIMGGVARTGESYYINQDMEGGKVTLEKPLAAVPLKIKEHVIGLVVIYKLLQQKDSFSAVDYELFSLLAAHAATAIFSSKLYSQSERKLNTIQSFLDLLTTTS
ncbi:MAG TPA: GAF domain-containing protein [Thermoanaerobaculia bacterium]|jgi:transcriptional regulator with GAF, ATPase, and Fis domain|nr:GAF domain-containing protein [Thermoanaerobaculia bacterium]